MTGRCPSELALEAYLADPARSIISAHVSRCARCVERLERMRADGDDFAHNVFPATVRAVEAAAIRAPWWRRPLFVLPIPAVAALAVALLVLRPPSAPPEDYVGVKGGAGGLVLTLFTPGPTGVAPVFDGGAVAAGAPIRFRVGAPAACHLWIVSIDPSGAVSRLFPPSGQRSHLVLAGEQELPGGAILDGRLGPERVYAVCTPHALPWTQLEGQVRGASARPASVRTPAPLTGLPPGSAWYSVLLEKRP